MDEYFFNGVWRLDWGLGNPNKTAALIAQLIVAIWWLAYAWKRGYWLALGLFAVLGGCLIHTFSRGGLIAAMIGSAAVLGFSKRPWPAVKTMATIASLFLLTTFAIHLNAHRRYAQGVLNEDRSLTNRAVLWITAPVMMADAPSGWGKGNSGKAFMQWYQPIQSTERYRTLVSSHLTWLVEFGWLLRFSYIFAWGAVFVLCFPMRQNQWMSVPLGIWAAFGTAMLFSSVAESPWVWIVPGCALTASVACRIKEKCWPKFRAWLFVSGIAGCACLFLALAGSGKSGISGSKSRVMLGVKPVSTWLVVDEEPLGGKEFAKTLRQYLADNPRKEGIGVVWSLTDLPDCLSNATIVITGAPDGRTNEQWRRAATSSKALILIAPEYYPQETGIELTEKTPVEVLFGEFSRSLFFTAWMNTGKMRCIDNTGDFLPNWPHIILEGNGNNQGL